MDCGCDTEWDGATDAKVKVWILYCPMHEAAAEMLEALKHVRDQDAHGRISIGEVLENLVDKAIAKAEKV